MRRLLAGAARLALAWLAWEWWTWPDVAALARHPPRTTAFIERGRDAERRAGRDGRIAWTWVPYGAISPHLERAAKNLWLSPSRDPVLQDPRGAPHVAARAGARQAP